jgi:hypothetical protein
VLFSQQFCDKLKAAQFINNLPGQCPSTRFAASMPFSVFLFVRFYVFNIGVEHAHLSQALLNSRKTCA